MKLLTKTLFTKQSGLVLVLLAASGSSSAAQIANNNITEAEIKAAQDAWGKALIQISDDYRSGGIDKARATATAVLDGAYGYHHGPVLFKPTLAGGEQTFRINQEGALAYFVGNNQAYPADTGFALKNWQSYNYDNAAVYINGDMALTMGKVHLTDRDNKQTTVDKTWGFKKGTTARYASCCTTPPSPTPANGNRRPAGRLFCYGGNSLATRRVTTGPVLLPCLPCDDSRRDTHADPPLHP